MSDSMTENNKRVLIVGGGYVGLPLAILAGSKGLNVTIFDSSTSRCRKLISGDSGFGPSVDDQLIELQKSNNLEVVDLDGFNSIAPSSVFGEIIICVPTPTDKHKLPDLTFVEQAVDSILHSLNEDTLLILESSTYPGTTRELVLPKIKSKFQSRDESQILLAYSPERVDPGNVKWNSSNTPRLVSGVNKLSLERASQFYRNLSIPVLEVSSPEIAEATKLFENSFRLVNISFVNEFSSVMRSLDLDPIEIIEAANTKPFGIMKFNPGPGVGGHCIPVDPYYLTWWAERGNQSLKLLKAAQEINEQMPSEAVKRIKGILGDNLARKRILLSGVTYKSGVADLRETPAEGIWDALEREHCILSWWDPLVDKWKEKKIWNGEFEPDLIVVVTKTEHKIPLSKSVRILDLNS